MTSRKDEIRKRFNRAAPTYDGYADVQQETAVELSRLLEPKGVTSILELGCGTGGFTKIVRGLFPEATLLGVDFSEAMVAAARENVGSDGARFLCADCEEYLETNQQRYDCICSNATFQWFQNPQLVLRNIHHALVDQGMFAASVFGPDCLADLGAGLQAVMGAEYLLPSPHFLGKKQLETLCHDFARVEISEQIYRRSYPSLFDLLRAIKYTGTGGFHAHVPRFNKRNLQALSDWFLDRGGFAVQYQVFFLKAIREG